MKKSELRQIIKEVIEEKIVPKDIRYPYLEKLVVDAIKKDDYDTFNDILIDMWNNNQGNLFFKLFNNFDEGHRLTRLLFKNMLR